ncbi:FAD:protein FMN transferase, partial [Patescibacteria group bacterium]
MNSNIIKPVLFSKEVKKEIMATDIYVGVIGEKSEEEKINNKINECFVIFKEFEKRFSRFIKNNELDKFNNSSGKIQVSDDLYEILKLSLQFYRTTKGVFDISIYPYLLNEGYVLSSKDGYIGETYYYNEKLVALEKLKLHKNCIVEKPENLIIELGGIGKGFIINKVKEFLKNKYRNFVVDAGGDIFYSGKDLVNGYKYWVCEIQSPFNESTPIETLTLSNKAIATSAINKRKWLQKGALKNHIIDPKTSKSISNEIASITVISSSIINADIMAKTLLIMGLE